MNLDNLDLGSHQASGARLGNYMNARQHFQSHNCRISRSPRSSCSADRIELPVGVLVSTPQELSKAPLKACPTSGCYESRSRERAAKAVAKERCGQRLVQMASRVSS